MGRESTDYYRGCKVHRVVTLRGLVQPSGEGIDFTSIRADQKHPDVTRKRYLWRASKLDFVGGFIEQDLHRMSERSSEKAVFDSE